ncbi:MBL fold metallo-hydrolase [Desulfatibacillum alkenivorans]|jgi:ribonuclease Z|nr:MBL fold metallo-hydrolase [Desulfatibacillum alkenivorans]
MPKTISRLKWLSGLLFGILFLIAISFAFNLENAIQKHVIAKKLEAQHHGMDILKDPGIRVIFAGTGVPVPSKDRGAQCIAVIANGELLIFDDGGAGVRSLAAWGYPIHKINKVFLTHLHSDHMAGLGGLIGATWIAGRTGPLRVYGPDDSNKLSHTLYPPTSQEYQTGTFTTGRVPDNRRVFELGKPDFPKAPKDYVPGIDYVLRGISMAYEPDVMERNGNVQTRESAPWEMGFAIPHPLPDMESAGTAPDFGWGELKTVYESESGKLKVKAFLVDHYACFPSYGYRIECGGQAVVISGDTEKMTYMAKCAKGADILIHEAVNMRMLEAIAAVLEEKYGDHEKAGHYRGASAHHTDSLDVARTAMEAGVSRLVLTHVIPPIDPGFIHERIFVKGMDDIFRGEIDVARDGMEIYLPPAASE